MKIQMTGLGMLQFRQSFIQMTGLSMLSVQAILHGPCLLAGRATSDWDIKNVAADSLSEWITPISPAHNDHLVTFTQRSRHSTLSGSIQTLGLATILLSIQVFLKNFDFF